MMERMKEGERRIVIAELREPAELDECLEVIRASFRTVADDFGITRENAPTNPAFLERGRFLAHLEKDVVLFGLRDEGGLAGCVAVEAASDEAGLFFVERLAVLPDRRHRGYGRALMDRAAAYARERGGVAVSVAIIDEHAVLKSWYQSLGFAVTGRREFDHLPFNVCFLRKEIAS